MNQWAFVEAAYAVVLIGSAGLAVQSWWAMRRAEKAAESLRKDK